MLFLWTFYSSENPPPPPPPKKYHGFNKNNKQHNYFQHNKYSINCNIWVVVKAGGRNLLVKSLIWKTINVKKLIISVSVIFLSSFFPSLATWMALQSVAFLSKIGMSLHLQVVVQFSFLQTVQI